MVDLNVREDMRGQGLGSTLILEMERLARESGHVEMLVGVDPESNPRALALYRRLGYVAIDPRPVEDRWDYVDSDGVRHAGVEWTIHLRKGLSGPQPRASS